MTIRPFLVTALTAALVLAGCDNDYDVPTPPVAVVPPAPEPIVPPSVTTMADGTLEARIRRTSYGVPHIEADSLQEIAFGSGYAQAEDHLCILADGFVKANSERSKFFGPHRSIDFNTGDVLAEDNQNIISDFGYKALGVRASAEVLLDTMPERSVAMMSGFTEGYNLYLSELETNQTPNLPCAGQAWVEPIEPVDLLTYLFSIALLPGSANFLDLIFFANPGDGDEYLPQPAATAAIDELSKPQQQLLAQIHDKARSRAGKITTPELNPIDLGSNGWGIGSELSANGKGIVLGNPHFPHTGQLRFWQSHLTIPGELDVMGGSLVGTPGIINIGFNQNLAWTHTFSTAEHFIMYNLALKEGDRLTYLYDGAELPIESELVSIDVNVGGGVVVPFEKTIYRTAKGVMVEAPPTLAPFAWDDSQAFFIQDANEENVDVLEHWLAMNLATNIDQFQQAFRDFDGVIFNNTMYADDQGNAFYIDDSTVPHISDYAQTALRVSPDLITIKEQAGFTIFPYEPLFAFDDAVPYDSAPKLVRQDFVQNSNNSYWVTNPAEPIEDVSPLYGKRRSEQTLRTRLGLTLLTDSSGDDGLFDPAEVEAALFSNRAYLGELVLPELLTQCEAQGSTGVDIGNGTVVDLTNACAALGQWNGAQNKDSIGGALLREFAHRFDTGSHLTQPFVSTMPVTTPAGLVDDGSALVILAQAAQSLTNAGFGLDAPLGSMQFIEKSLPDGSASGAKIAISGSNNREGGFNVFSYSLDSRDDTLLPQHAYTAVTDPVSGEPLRSQLSTEGYHVRYGSSWMMVVGFGDNGPTARGLLTYSQSNNFQSPHWNDQTQYYSDNNNLRPLLFTEDEIAAATSSDKVIRPAE
ncbi:penicillin acylase family protein [Ferrimonas lipolytica]|uniref:Acylase n=1 Tax=Ferrimonas lipolytica TaxID=2724191 RepID=A0A6H1UFC7_9GAMM|nr:penicillin acylase family protein [Ferrimonas lipolytica]QIZ77805.1 acylase [Ferrimonas lipolytica]